MNWRHQRIAFALLSCALVAFVVWTMRPSKATKLAPVAPTLRHDLVRNHGLWFHVGSTNPFSGVMVDYYPDGRLCSRCEIADGLVNGVSEMWYTNGQIQVREHYKSGIADGLRERWHTNGKLLSRAMLDEGKVTGTFQSWYANGQLNEQIDMVRGAPAGTAYAYYPSGCLRAETRLQAGQVVNRKIWKDGERKVPPVL